MIFIGYITGIIWGLYVQLSIVPFYVFLYVIKNISELIAKTKVKSKRFDIYSFKRYLRYVRLVINKKEIYMFILISIISNVYMMQMQIKYDTTYLDGEKIALEGYVIEINEEKEYNNTYVISVKNSGDYSGTKIYVLTDKNTKLEYGMYVKVEGDIIIPEVQRNYMGFSYKEYLKTKGIYASIDVCNVEAINNKKSLLYELLGVFYNTGETTKLQILNIMEPEKAAIVIGLTFGDTTYIEDEYLEKFRIANIAHILAISGMHISYIMLFSSKIGSTLFGAKIGTIFTSIILVGYILIAKMSPSILRAVIMGEVLLVSKIINKKVDIISSVCFAGMITLIYNPYIITSLGFMLSYLGLLGIIFFQKDVYMCLSTLFSDNRRKKHRVIVLKLKSAKKVVRMRKILIETIAVTLSVQMMIFPIIIYSTNLISPYFLITNILSSFLVPFIIFFSFLISITININPSFSQDVTLILNNLLDRLIQISEMANLPYAKIYIPTISIKVACVYYLIIIVGKNLVKVYTSKNKNRTQIRVKSTVAMYRYRSRGWFDKHKTLGCVIKKWNVVVITIVVLIYVSNINIFTFSLKDIIYPTMKIRMIDVGQGDSIFITTPRNQTILIDGGGVYLGKYDVGKKVVLPYLLDRGFATLDYVIISHFDTDHVGGILSIMEEIKIENILICEQGVDSRNYHEFKEICSSRNINVIYVGQGDRLTIEKDIVIDVLWPRETQLTNNILNNNSLVFKIAYNDTSMLFTGDIEEEAEKILCAEYMGKLEADILKVAHHGSKTSTTGEMLEYVNPRIALIGVGKNNMFNHPSEDVIDNLIEKNIKICRTDILGEIEVTISKTGRIYVNSQIE